MSLIMRLIYLVALVAVAAVYTVTMPSESLSLMSLIKHLAPATGVGLLFVLAKGMLGEGLVKHVMALVIIVAVIAVVSVSLSATGMVTAVERVADMFSNASGTVNSSLNLGIP